MDYLTKEIRATIQSTFLPVIAIACTPSVEKICQAHNVKLVDLFQRAQLDKKRSMCFL